MLIGGGEMNGGEARPGILYAIGRHGMVFEGRNGSHRKSWLRFSVERHARDNKIIASPRPIYSGASSGNGHESTRDQR